MVCFAVWLMFGMIGIPIRNELGLNGAEFGLLTATPSLDRYAIPSSRYQRVCCGRSVAGWPIATARIT